MACRRWRNAAARSFLKVPIKSRGAPRSTKRSPGRTDEPGLLFTPSRSRVRRGRGGVWVPNCKQNSGCVHQFPERPSPDKVPQIEAMVPKRSPGEAAAKPGLLGWVLVWRGTTSTPVFYYNLVATPWGYRGQPLESMLGVILVPLL